MDKEKSMYETLREEIALFRYSLIADVVRLKPGTSGIYQKLQETSQMEYKIPGTTRTLVAAETLRSWIKKYRSFGFDGLYPKIRKDRGKARKLPQEVIDVLIEIKEKNRELTVKQVIASALSSRQIATTIELPPSTVHRILEGAGLMEKLNHGSTKDRRRFSFHYAGQLLMSDVMHGPAVVKDGQRKYKTYLIAFLDDATRVITHAAFCFSENTNAFLPILKKAILRRGIPERLYVDNGSAYRSRQLELVCAKLGITLIHARPYQPQGKGKIERFFRTVRMQFLNQVLPKSIEEMNQQFWAWVEGEYHLTPHRGLEGETPMDRWAQRASKVKMVEPQFDLDDLFLWETKRLVRSDRTVSLNGLVYEIAAELVGQKVLLRYDPSAPKERPIQVWYQGQFKQEAKLLDAYGNCYVKRERPSWTIQSSQLPQSPKRSLSFTKFNKEDNDV